MWKRAYLTIFLFLAAVSARAADPDFSDYKHLESKVSFETVAERAKLLVKTPAVEQYFRITPEEITFYASPADKAQDRAEFRFALGKEESPLKEPKPQTLVGRTIALDPGHFGGAYAKLEARYIDMKDFPATFNEGDLALEIAQKLKTRLEARGAKVILSRQESGRGALRLTFEEWMATPEWSEDLDTLLAKIPDDETRQAAKAWWGTVPKETFFFLYNNRDLKARADLINAEHPDLTVCLHLNAAAGRENGKNLSATENYHMLFTAGSFMETTQFAGLDAKKKRVTVLVNEASDRRSRVEMLRLLVTPDLSDSIAVSKSFVQAMAKNLPRVPAAKGDEKSASYLRTSCLPTPVPGVFARNLVTTRLVHGRILYAESLCQDYPEVARDIRAYLPPLVDAYEQAIVQSFGQ
jgi:N-acetylmuramoyl-L-alanine amidase